MSRRAAAYPRRNARLNYDPPDDCEDHVHRIGRTVAPPADIPSARFQKLYAAESARY